MNQDLKRLNSLSSDISVICAQSFYEHSTPKRMRELSAPGKLEDIRLIVKNNYDILSQLSLPTTTTIELSLSSGILKKIFSKEELSIAIDNCLDYFEEGNENKI